MMITLETVMNEARRVYEGQDVSVGAEVTCERGGITLAYKLYDGRHYHSADTLDALWSVIQDRKAGEVDSLKARLGQLESFTADARVIAGKEAA